MTKKLNDYLGNNKSHAKLIELFYKAKEETHLMHNVQKSKDKSIHEAIGGFYTFVEEFIDGFTESVFGIYGTVPLNFNSSTPTIDALSYMENLYSQVEIERKFFKESWIQNEIDNFQKSIAMTLYQLKYVRSNP